MSGNEMNLNTRTLTLHMVSSLDGFIAKRDNSVAWLDGYAEVYEAGVSEHEAAGLIEPIDCFVLGSRTYEHALQLGWPYGDTPTVVTTNRELPRPKESVEFYAGDLKKLVDVVLARRKRIWLVGGAVLCRSFLELGLVDEMRLSIAPVLLGDGLRLFGGGSPTEERWKLKNVVAYKNGFVELLYGI
jgi:dihydrofolate reductase